jgi:hypothetical protein
VARQISLGVVSLVSILSSPFITARGEFVGSKRARSWGETASDDDSLLPVPGAVLSHDFSVRRDILRRELGQLVWLRVHPSKGLHFLKILVARKLVGEVDCLMGAPLRRHHDATNFLHLRVIGRADSIQVSSNLELQYYWSLLHLYIYTHIHTNRNILELIINGLKRPSVSFFYYKTLIALHQNSSWQILISANANIFYFSSCF